jgi:ABC-type transporter Mla subunit MlaD
VGEDNELSRAIADGRVITIKEHLKDLRAEDQRAVSLLGNEISKRLDKFGDDFKDLKASVDQFHAAVSSQQEQFGKDTTSIFSVATLIVSIAVGGIMIFLYLHK